MKVHPILLVLLLSFNFSFSQKSFTVPDFGKVDKSELLLKECEFDKAAEAVVLFDVAEVYCSFFPTSYSAPVASELTRHVRIKILKDKGLNNANIRIPYYSFGRTEKIKNISAQTYNLDAAGNIVITKLEKKLVYEKKINKRYSEEVFTFPEVKAGSVIEYEYTLKSEGFGGLKYWYFQKSIPVTYSSYTINFPQDFIVSATPKCYLPYNRTATQKSDRDIQTYTMVNVPALPDEPFITTKDDYLQHLEPRIVAVNTPTRRIPVTRSWPEMIRGLMEDEDFGLQLKKEIPRTADLDDALKNLRDPYQKMATIYYYVRSKMEWNGYNSIWALDGVKSAWKDKKGTAGEINLILVNLLKDADLKAHAILVSTKDNGRVNPGVAEVSQFDKVMAYVALNEKEYILDATDKFTPPDLIPLDVMYSEGLLIEKPLTFEWGWTVIWDKDRVFKNYVNVLGEISEDGKLTGQSTITSMGYERVMRSRRLKEGREKYIEDNLRSVNPGAKIDSFTVENESQDSLPLLQSFNYSMPLASSGSYKYFTLNMFTGFERNVFVSDNRQSDVFFGANQYYNINASFLIPENYVFDELPKNIKMIMPDTSISVIRRISTHENQLLAHIVVEFKKPVFSPEEYPDFMEFYKKLFDLLNEQIVIKKKG
jgi:hypothetical protein